MSLILFSLFSSAMAIRIACIATAITPLVSVIYICLITACCCPEFISGSSGALSGSPSFITHHSKFVLHTSSLIATSRFASVTITALIFLTAAQCSAASA